MRIRLGQGRLRRVRRRSLGLSSARAIWFTAELWASCVPILRDIQLHFRRIARHQRGK